MSDATFNDAKRIAESLIDEIDELDAAADDLLTAAYQQEMAAGDDDEDDDADEGEDGAANDVVQPVLNDDGTVAVSAETLKPLLEAVRACTRAVNGCDGATLLSLSVHPYVLHSRRSHGL